MACATRDYPIHTPIAISSMVTPIPKSITLHAAGWATKLETLLAPYPNAKKNAKDAAIAPPAKKILSVPSRPTAPPPINSTVSRYTCGFNQVKPNVNAIVLPMELGSEPASMLSPWVPISEDLNLNPA